MQATESLVCNSYHIVYDHSIYFTIKLSLSNFERHLISFTSAPQGEGGGYFMGNQPKEKFVNIYPKSMYFIGTTLKYTGNFTIQFVTEILVHIITCTCIYIINFITYTHVAEYVLVCVCIGVHIYVDYTCILKTLW